jgi:hypothetical protein
MTDLRSFAGFDLALAKEPEPPRKTRNRVFDG